MNERGHRNATSSERELPPVKAVVRDRRPAAVRSHRRGRSPSPDAHVIPSGTAFRCDSDCRRMLSAVIPMKRLSIALFTLIALGTVALAQSLPQNGIVTVTTDNGAVVGLGSIEHGQLSLELNAGLNAGPGATLNIAVTGTGGTQTLTATIDTTGTITVTAGGQSQDLASYARAAGLSGVEVSMSGDVSAGSDTNHASDTGQTESSDNAAAPSQEDGASAGDHSQGNAQVSGSTEAGDGSGSADSETESETNVSAGSGDDSVDVGTSLDSTTSVSGGN